MTLEDLIEELVGEIYDETDRDVTAVRREADGSMVLPGGFPIHDLVDLGIDLNGAADRGYATVAGLVLDRLGRIPEGPGDLINVGDWHVEVTAVDRHAITEIHIHPATVPAGRPAQEP